MPMTWLQRITLSSERVTLAPLFLIQVKDKGDGKGAAGVIAALSKDPKVKKADLNYLTTIDKNTTP